jgi:hypothetical protein
MAVCCDLEVDVNGEETFMVDKVKKLISLFLFSFPLTLPL